jgi:hypothetical protein
MVVLWVAAVWTDSRIATNPTGAFRTFLARGEGEGEADRP